MRANAPKHLDLKKDRGLTIEWADGTGSYYSVAYLRRMSPSAEMRELRHEMSRNPLTVLPSSQASDSDLRVTLAELVGNYAIRIEFSDGHRTAIYSWDYLRQIDPARESAGDTPPGTASHDDPLGLGRPRTGGDR